MNAALLALVAGIAVGTGLTFWGWAVWLRGRLAANRTWRDTTAFSGLVALSIACAMFLGTVAYSLATSGFGSDPSTPRFLARISIWLCLAAVAASVLGRARYRLAVFLGAVSFGLLWLMVATLVP